MRRRSFLKGLAASVGATLLGQNQNAGAAELLSTGPEPEPVTFTVDGLVEGDRVFVAPEEFPHQLMLARNMTPVTDPRNYQEWIEGHFLQVVGEIPADTPKQGSVRVLVTTGEHLRCEYSSYDTDTFTLKAPFSGTAPAGAPVYVTYIDREAVLDRVDTQYIYTTDRPLLVRVRNGLSSPIQTFESQATLGRSGGSVTAVRVPDSYL